MVIKMSSWGNMLGSDIKISGRKYEDVVLGLKLLGNKLVFSEGR